MKAPRLRGRAAWLPTLVALAAGVIFVTIGVGHFADHGSEVADFRGYEVPFASLAVWGVGVVELGGGLALLLVWAGPGALSLDAGLRRRSPAAPQVGVAAF